MMDGASIKAALPPTGIGDGELLGRRREILAALDVDIDDVTIPQGSMGLALSGGGIRSATIALGLVQALTRHKRLLDFDYLSTVSGGGYLGSFLTSLFVPDEKRGRKGSPSTVGPLDAKGTLHFVERVLSEDARQETIDDPFPNTPAGAPVSASGTSPPDKLRNPIWWLREHGRYLAPSGPTDFTYAISYVARNWLAMIYTFTVAAAAFFFFATLIEYAVLASAPDLTAYLHIGGAAPSPMLDAAHGTHPAPHAPATPPPHRLLLSPLIVLPLVLLALAVATGLSYWLTVSLRTGNPWQGKAAGPRPAPFHQFLGQTALVLGATVGCIVVLRLAGAIDHLAMRPFATFWRLGWPWWPVALGVDLMLIGLAIGLLVAVPTAFGQSGDAFTNEFRRRLTKLGAFFNQLLAISLALAVVDTAALALATAGLPLLASHGPSGLFSFTAIPAAAALIGKLPQWLGRGWLSKLLGEYVWTIALVAGVLLFGLVALAADTAVQAIAWPNGAWQNVVVAGSGSFGFATARFLWVGLIVGGLFVLTGVFTGFINLSSLHNLYAGKLSRAYMGASNIARLRQAAAPRGAPITENHPKDYVDVSCYQNTPSAAPLHLINVTLNETRSDERSQLVDRDRKGVPVVFAPDGIYVDAARARTLGEDYFFGWKALEDAGVESLGVGQLCAISGAAAGSGMGARTTLGGALAFTFANVRLGYWWMLQDLLPEVREHAASGWWRFRVAVTRPFRTYFYLWNEMTATYARANRQVYLSDGGHFENSGAYELLRRMVRVMLVCDNGADPDYLFEDLENFTRKARIDMGRAIIVAPPSAVRAIFGSGAALFFNGKDGDWRAAARAGTGPAFALLLDIYATTAQADGTRGLAHERCGRIVWLKPRRFDGLPPDVIGYGERNETFPQQTTGDQFFDEAQWESYRALGYSMADILFSQTRHRADVLRALIHPRGGGRRPSKTTPVDTAAPPPERAGHAPPAIVTR